MAIKATDIELAIWRSSLLSARAAKRPFEVTQRCEVIARHARKFEKARLQACNGVDRWDAKAGCMLSGLTEDDQLRIDETLRCAEAAIIDQLKPILTRGLVYDFRHDPRAAVCRVVNRENTKDFWINA